MLSQAVAIPAALKAEDDLTMAVPVPKDVMVLGRELVVVWEDGREDYIPLEKLRRGCPCAMCKGETDMFGNVYKGKERPYTPASFQAIGHRRVGGYALQVDWADRHNDGLYSWETLRRLADEASGPGPAVEGPK